MGLRGKTKATGDTNGMKKMAMAAVALACCAVACGVFSARAGAALKVLEPEALTFEAGKYAQSHEKDLYFAQLRPEYVKGGLTASFILTLAADKGGEVRDSGNDFFVVDAIEYTNGKRLAARYREIEGLTFGSGFVVSDYRSNMKGHVPLNRQRGVEIDIDGSNSYVKYFATRSRLQGLRAVRNFGPFSLGCTALDDSSPEIREYAADAEIYLPNGRATIYAETADIKHHGEGFAVGAMGKVTRYASLKAEFRDFDADFSPGMVDAHYDARRKLDRVVGAEGRLSGLFTAADLFFDKYKIYGRITFEDYEQTKSRFTFLGNTEIMDRARLEFFYAQESGVPDTADYRDAVGRATIVADVRKDARVKLDFYNGYDDAENSLESVKLSAEFDLR